MLTVLTDQLTGVLKKSSDTSSIRKRRLFFQPTPSFNQPPPTPSNLVDFRSLPIMLSSIARVASKRRLSYQLRRKEMDIEGWKHTGCGICLQPLQSMPSSGTEPSCQGGQRLV